jgi:1-deoxy-D-xylulose-5-phosphate synthase
MESATGLGQFDAAYPDRFFDVGIAEAHAVTFAAGLAKGNMHPLCAIYSSFLQRAYDQILEDICLQDLPCVLAIDRAGLVGEDGETHHGVFDVGFLRHAQGMEILCPASTAELETMLCWAVLDCTGSVAVRYPRGGDGCYTLDQWDVNSPVVTHRKGCDGAIVTYGTLVNEALAAAELLERKGIHAAVIRMTRIEPMPLDALQEVLRGQTHILLAEEAIGGLAESLAWQLSQRLPDAAIAVRDLGRDFVPHGDMASLYKQYGLDAESLAEKFMEVRKVEK